MKLSGRFLRRSRTAPEMRVPDEQSALIETFLDSGKFLTLVGGRVRFIKFDHVYLLRNTFGDWGRFRASRHTDKAILFTPMEFPPSSWGAGYASIMEAEEVSDAV